MLFVAAEPFEVRWIESRPGLTVETVTGGAGPRCAARALETVTGGYDVVVSTGLCGGLNPSLRVGDIFVASGVNKEPVTLPKTNEVFHSGPLLSMDRVVGTAREKRQWYAAGFDAVEMEAAAAHQYARERDMPFFCVRAVSDVAEEEFALDLNAARDGSGRIRAGSVLLQAARRPRLIVPELLRLRRNAEKAARALGAFIAKCDF